MVLKEQVMSLELAKKMKALNFPQESLWWWCKGTLKHSSRYGIHDKSWVTGDKWNLYRQKIAETFVFLEKYPAFTCAELGEMLPKDIYTEQASILHTFKWVCRGKNNNTYANTEANARAKMLIYLKERG